MLGRGLRRRGYRVLAICHAAEAAAGMRAALVDAGVEVRTIEGDGDRSLAGHLRRNRSYAALIREYRGCVLALMMGYFTRGGGVTLAGALAGAGAIVRADLTPPEPPITLRQKLALRLKDRLLNRVVVGAIENRDAFARQMRRAAAKIDVIHTGIELDRFQPGEGREAVRNAFAFQEDTLLVGTVSRLSDERKGLKHFIDMAATVAPAHPPARFLIVGDGVLRPGLEQRARELGIADRVIFAGWRTDIPEMLAAMDVFVMPSLFEGGPTTVLEAMAMAKPVVASRVGMVPEVLEHGETGLIVKPGDSHALADAVDQLLSDGTLRARMAERARRKSVDDFSIDLMVERYLTVFAHAYRRRNSV
jgi:glycosyltransferase involved in cell wall biosynthesis